MPQIQPQDRQTDLARYKSKFPEHWAAMSPDVQALLQRLDETERALPRERYEALLARILTSAERLPCATRPVHDGRGYFFASQMSKEFLKEEADSDDKAAECRGSKQSTLTWGRKASGCTAVGARMNPGACAHGEVAH